MPSPRFWRLAKIILPVALILFTSAYFLTFSEWTYKLVPSSSSWKSPGSTSGAQEQEDPDVEQRKEAFIQKATEWQIDGPYNHTALSNLCASKDWVEGLQFRCAPAYGGIGNVRNIVLTCVRFAIEAGGKFYFPSCHTSLGLPPAAQNILSGKDIGSKTNARHANSQQPLSSSPKSPLATLT